MPKDTESGTWLTELDVPGHSVEPSPEPGMRVTPRVELVRELARGGMGAVWVARHLTLGIDVAVKFLLADDPVRRERMSREARLAARVDHPNAVRIHDSGVTETGTPFIVMELLDGPSLAERIDREGPLTVAEVRRLVAQVGAALEAAHHNGVVHRDVKPSNIVLLSTSSGLFAKLVDFGIAKPMEASDLTLTRAGHVVGTMFYMAPEQLIDGLPPDHRADLWGLAVVAYEALVRRRPYDGRSMAGVGAAMVLRRFDPPTTLDPSLPAALDAWFDRALKLEPDARFASARELVETFEAAASSSATDIPRRAAPVLRLPDRLYGRDRELAALGRAFDQVHAGRSRMVLVSGYSGVGKTALVRELRARLSGRATFVAGKFDQFDRGTPYASLLQAFRELVRQALSDAAALPAWRERVRATVGDLAPALVEVIADLEPLLGTTTTPAEAASPTEQRNRLHVAMGRLISAFASPERPLVLFLDDLQWADLPTFDLLTTLATDPESRHVLLLGAHRHQSGAGHPLVVVLERLRAAQAVDEVALGPLGEDAVLDLVSDTFPTSPGRMRFAAACHAKTHGNAFFLRRFLESLVDGGVVRFDADARQWTWDPAAVDAVDMADDVVEFVAAEISRLPPRTREAVAVAAVVGDRFELDTLARAIGVERGEALGALGPALAIELLAATGPSGSVPGPDDDHRLVFRFTHDRVRQAARAAIDDEAAAAVHRRVGRFLLDTLRGAERERRLFELVEHLNRGFATEPSSAESAQLRALNLAAARRALRSAAFDAAHLYLQHARRHLGPDAWTSDYAQTLALHVEGARAAYLAGRSDQMELLVEVAVGRARDVVDAVSAQEVRVQGFLSQRRFGDALRVALDALASLGMTAPRDPTGADVEAAVGATLRHLASFGEVDLEALPTCADPLVQARQRVQIAAMSSAYMAAPTLLPILACDIVRATLEHGVCKESPYGFAALGLVLVAGNQIDVAYAMGRIAADMLDRVGDRAMRPRTLHLLAAFVRPFVDPLRDSIDTERQVARLGLDTGDLEYAGWGLHIEVCNSFYAGVDLATLARTYERNTPILEHHQQLPPLGCTVQYGQALARLRGGADLVELERQEAERMRTFRAGNFRGAAFIQTVVGTFLRYVFGDAPGAAAWADDGAAFADGAAATYHVVWWHQYRALAVLASRDADPRAALEAVAPNLAQLRIWQRAAPHNHDHRVHLVDGEIARVLGRRERALAHFDEAVASAATHGFLHEEALAHELAARCHAADGQATAERSRLERARAAWARWGATAKVAELDRRLASKA